MPWERALVNQRRPLAWGGTYVSRFTVADCLVYSTVRSRYHIWMNGHIT